MPSDPYDTPAMRQWKAMREANPGCLVFFRMGDFYELFGPDAVAAHEKLGLTLAKRSSSVELAGVPHHQLATYLKKAVDAGFRVAVADQVQDPKDAKGVVERAVTRVVTPGTLVDEELLSETQSAAVMALTAPAGDAPLWHAAIADLSTGAIELTDIPAARLADEAIRAGVREILYPGDPKSDPPPAIAAVPAVPTPRPSWHARDTEAREAITSHYRVATLEGFGLRTDDPAIPALGLLVRFFSETQSVGADPVAPEHAATSGGEFQTQRRTLAHLRPPTRRQEGATCRLDAVSLRALEIERVLRPTSDASPTAGSLLGVFLEAQTGPRCVVHTPMGKRLLRRWLTEPLSQAAAIRQRHDAVATLCEDRRLAAELADHLAEVADIERLASRVALGRATPRDLVALARSIAKAQPIATLVEPAAALRPIAAPAASAAKPLTALAEAITTTCVEEPPPHLRQGGLIKPGIDPELDEARALERDAGEWLAKEQARLIEQHDLPNLKVGYNKVFGYYIELPKAQAQRAPAEFHRKQTLKNAERYITPELKTFEEKVTSATDRALARERAIFQQLLDQAAAQITPAQEAASAIAAIDVLAAFAEKAHRRGWTRPEITDDPVLDIDAGRHPVLDELLGDRFVPNAVVLGGSHPPLALITGPNMAGKSTYIRQTALLAILAAAGSFVPASKATIGTADRVFTRVGADDALHRGQSTFMVEMTETAAILNNATERSLVILDEIGRGTSTLDGLSLAWAIAESLAGGLTEKNPSPGPRTLFATHYHELTDLEHQQASRVRNLHVAVREWKGDIVFVHEIKPGAAGASYGVHVARLAGIPRNVTDRAEEVLSALRVEHQDHAPRPAPTNASKPAAEPTLFDAPHPVVESLREIKLESLSPLEAFDLLRELRTQASTD